MKELIKKFIPNFLFSWYHFLLAFLGALIYQFPSRKLKVVGVTGTNGKTTVVEMSSKILEEAGFKVASMSSIKFKIGEKEWLNTLKMTMPGRFKIQKFLREAVNKGCQYAVLEVTSEGIAQYRHKFITFEVAVFTNLTPEHLEAHGGFENYKRTKGKLFRATKGIHILNLQDENFRYFSQFPAKTKYGYAIHTQRTPFSLETISKNKIRFIEAQCPSFLPSGISFNVREINFNLKLPGEFNIYNALAAICVGISQGIDLKICQRALKKIKKIPGRMEEVISKPFRVFVDYAFTPNALEKVYQLISLKFKAQNSNLICVLGGCGGGRDKWKRPVLGQLAAKYCDQVIITNEDPYDEDPMKIIEQVFKGTKEKGEKILDRREAIKRALVSAKDNDLIIITGKGCEPWICIKGNKKIPWDDREVVKEEFKKLVPFLKK